MRRQDVKVGGRYRLKVSGRMEPVTITEEKWSGKTHMGWAATFDATARSVRIKDPNRLMTARELNAAARTQAAEDPTSTIQTPPVTEVGDKGGGVKHVAAANHARPTESANAKRPTRPTSAPATPSRPKRLSALDAAAQVLADCNNPMNSKELIQQLTERSLWHSLTGKTPHATLYAAILREIAAKGSQSRFKKTDRGMFARA